MIDLHTHSSASDGLLPPADLVREAERRGVGVLALTDHDTVGGLAEADETGRRLGVRVIPGVELGASVDRQEVHLLGYFVDSGSAAFVQALDELASRRRVRMREMVERLNELGVAVSLAEVLAVAGAGSVGRPHLARVLVQRGEAADIGDAFERYLAAGRPAYVRRQPLSLEEAIALIRSAGGVAVLAHPLTIRDPAAMVERLHPLGLAGLEVFYGEYDPPTRSDLLALADRYDLIPTGGSDFHGAGFKHGRELGGPGVPPESVARLEAASGRSSASGSPTFAPGHPSAGEPGRKS